MTSSIDLRSISKPLTGPRSLDPLMDEIGQSRFVLLGEASHGTHEYYQWRSLITQRLIREKEFNIIGVEGDWPDCYRLNRYIKGYPDAGETASLVLQNFNRWPTWMWANWEMVALAEWLRKYNQGRNAEQKVGFYGLDVYSLWESMEAIQAYLKKRDPVALKAVVKAMACFEPYGIREGFSYAARSYGWESSCEDEVEDLLADIRFHMDTYKGDPEAAFGAEQNALVAVNAERYYQVMLRGGEASWNVRDRHMSETVNRLMNFHGPDSKIIIWEHNTHIGDATATDMRQSGMINVGQLIREEHAEEGVYRVGFGSYKGTVIAADDWGEPMQEMKLPDAKNGSWERMLHDAGAENRLVFSRDIQSLDSAIGHRAVGVVYDPDNERGNYVPSIIPRRYEAFMFIDKTSALHPLHLEPDGSQLPDTYPWGV